MPIASYSYQKMYTNLKNIDNEKQKNINTQSKRQGKKKVIEGTSQGSKPSSGKAWIIAKYS